MSFAEFGTSDEMFWTQNPEIFVQQCRFLANVFSENEFCRFWDMLRWCLFLSWRKWDPMSFQKQYENKKN
jgi:hypothetical protein